MTKLQQTNAKEIMTETLFRHETSDHHTLAKIIQDLLSRGIATSANSDEPSRDQVMRYQGHNFMIHI